MIYDRDPHPGQRQCRTCQQWKSYKRFNRWRDARASSDITTGNAEAAWSFAPDCLDCQQKKRNETKNEDRAREIIHRRAANAGRKAQVSTQFMWENMNYQALVPVFRAMMSDEGLCIDCGHPFDSESDITIEHREPPRHSRDWARHHARNLSLACRGCNSRKNDVRYAEYLDLEEEVRQSNEADEARAVETAVPQLQIVDSGRCESKKQKTYDGKPSKSWRCKLPAGHDGPHRVPGQSPWQ